jgi:uncharacterized membrane protein YcaP (DUF421 family)
MSEWFFQGWLAVPMVMLCTLAIYAAVIFSARITGLRSFAKMSGFDFAMTIAIGSIIASTALTQNPPLLQGLAGVMALFAAQAAVAKLRRHTKWAPFVFDNRPILVMRNGEILSHNLNKASMTEADVYVQLRKANVIDIDQVKAMVMETTGDVSVIHTGDKDANIPDEMLEHVRTD